MPEYELCLRFTAADGLQAERLAEAWADTCAAEYGTRFVGLQPVSDRLTDSTDTACEWCGRAIRQVDGVWWAVKGEERRYPSACCEANRADGRHNPSASST